jgi:hypothetical protein
MISQMVRNESVKFDRHIDIKVSYKILLLEISKLVLILHYLACFQNELFGGNFEQKHPWSFRGQVVCLIHGKDILTSIVMSKFCLCKF